MEIDTVVCGDCLDILPAIPSQSVDAVITDPSYPHIKRDYGYWTTEEWWELIVEGVIPEIRRTLKPTGSAVFILQPNSEKVGKMRGWLWEFMAWVCREWNMVQDVWWWNINALPNVHTQKRNGLMRPSLKACVWCGLPDCYRKQDSIMWSASDATMTDKRSGRALKYRPSGYSFREGRSRNKAKQTGRATPFNVIPLSNGQGREDHGASTPLILADWWVRYIVPKGGLIVDPFMGSGTMAIAAIQNRCHFFGCDTMQDYVDITNKRIEKAKLEASQLELPLLNT